MKCNVCGKDLAYIEDVGYMIHSHCEYKAYAEYLNLKLTIEVLQSENEQLRAVLENAKETLEMLHPTMNPDEPCFIYETWDAVSKALGGKEEHGDKT